MPYFNIQNDGAAPYPTSPAEAGTAELIRDGVDTPGSGLVRLHVGATGIGDLYTTHVNGTGTAPVVTAVLAGLGTGGSVTSFTGHDMGGGFTAWSGGGTAGTIATVAFGTALAAAPVSVQVSIADNTNVAPLAAGANALSTTGFAIMAPTTTSAHTYQVCYTVIAS